MPLRDEQRGDWIADIRAILDVNQKVAYDLHSLLCNHICHNILEQLLSNPDQEEFVIPLAPLGSATLYRKEDGSWDIKDLVAGKSFSAAVNETLRCKESRLYRDAYDRAYSTLTASLKRFAAENLT